MGMAASQARFLGLTARKTNTEYEGQQINQQRTVLGNQSANYYNQLLGMTVPKPPSVSDFTKTVYTFSDGSLNNSITSMIAKAGGMYQVSYLREWIDDFSVVSTTPSIVYRNKTSVDPDPVTYDYRIGNDTLRQMNRVKLAADGTIDSIEYPVGQTVAQAREALKNSHQHFKNMTDPELDRVLIEESEELALLKEKGTENWVMRYIENSSTGAMEPQFYNLDTLNAATTVYDDNGRSQSSIPAFRMGSAKKTDEVKGVAARVEQDTSGRLINITLEPGTDKEAKYALTTNTVKDETAYDDAMNKYTYDKYQYDQTIQEVNAKIEVVQVQDRNLELRLKQLDTEQKAIQTEMDAVTKVVEKNVEKTFNTFG